MRRETGIYHKRDKENENLNEMNKNTRTWKISKEEHEGTRTGGIFARDDSGGNYFTTDDKKIRRARRRIVKKIQWEKKERDIRKKRRNGEKGNENEAGTVASEV